MKAFELLSKWNWLPDILADYEALQYWLYCELAESGAPLEPNLVEELASDFYELFINTLAKTGPVLIIRLHEARVDKWPKTNVLGNQPKSPKNELIRSKEAKLANSFDLVRDTDL